MARPVEELQFYLRAWRAWVRAWRAPLGAPSAVSWANVIHGTPAWETDDSDPGVDSFILRAVDAEVESLPPNKRAAVRQYYLNEALTKLSRTEIKALCAEAEIEMIPRLRTRGVVLGA